MISQLTVLILLISTQAFASNSYLIAEVSINNKAQATLTYDRTRKLTYTNAHVASCTDALTFNKGSDHEVIQLNDGNCHAYYQEWESSSYENDIVTIKLEDRGC